MTYDEALEATKTMQSCAGMHITIRQATPGNPNTFYPDYVHNNPMYVIHEMELRAHGRMVDELIRFNKPKHKSTPPTGRDQKQHNLIQSMNRNKRFK